MECFCENIFFVVFGDFREARSSTVQFSIPALLLPLARFKRYPVMYNQKLNAKRNRFSWPK